VPTDSTQAVAGKQSLVTGLVALLRPRQWVKNSFVLAPLIFSGAFSESASIITALWATLIFSLAASAAYVVNDLRDVEQDRLHPRKSQSRPLASGAIRPGQAYAVLGVLYGLVIVGCLILPAMAWTVVGYLALNIAYSFVLKHQPIIDIFTVAFGFVLRVYAGAVAIDVPVSSWMFVTTLCLALYLAAIKRRQELRHNVGDTREVLKFYSVALVERYAEMAATCALIFYSLFVMSAQPELVITIPIVLFGLFRYWMVVEMNDAGESPTDALLSDWQLLLTVGAWVGASLWALWPEGV